ncbi:ABC transporter substrate-binding protein [Nocardioides sp. NPDC051685]|uniref:ABC transporter substrate-binding protein n=1 Tax=Nocardioides sp. NPDC051685 TaxID=3364334 RepID=UPI0037B5AC19
MHRMKTYLAVAASAALLAGCGSGDPLATEAAGADEKGTITVGSADFPESALIAEIYAGALEAKGVKVEKTLNIGSREAYVPALQDGSIDLIPEYTGALLHYFDEDATATDSESVYEALTAAAPKDLSVLTMSSAEDKDVVAVTKETAEKYSLTSIGDLAEVSDELVLGGPPEWKTRRQGVKGLADVYGVEFGTFRALDAGGPLTVQALKNGQVDAADLFTTDPSIQENGFIMLDDPESLFPAENVVPLIARSKVDDKVSQALDGVSAELDTETLATLVKQVIVDKKDAEDVAAEFLTEQGLA